jgi:hypothetical protein
VPLAAEAIRESDIAKLSFAVQLADGLFGHEAGDASEDGHRLPSIESNGLPGALAHDVLSGSFEPGALLFLIQRDFLLGGGAQQAVDEALAPVPNPSASVIVAIYNWRGVNICRMMPA